MKSRALRIAFLIALVGVAGLVAETQYDPLQKMNGWRRLLSFNMTQEATRKADIGNHTMLIAGGDASRWDIEVRQYPLSKNTENLLHDGNNWHGLQPWMLLPSFVTNNPHICIVTYEKGKSQLMIVAQDCLATNGARFTSGTLDLYHKP